MTLMHHYSLGACRLDRGAMGLLLFPLGHQWCIKSLRVTTHVEPVKEVISWVLVLHEQLQVLEHLERRKGWPQFRDKEQTAPRHLPHLHLPPYPNRLRFRLMNHRITE